MEQTKLDFSSCDATFTEVTSLEGLIMAGNVVLGTKETLFERGVDTTSHQEKDEVTHQKFFGENIERVKRTFARK